MKKFNIIIDVTMSGNLEIEAETEDKARALALSKVFTTYDLKTFHFLYSEIFDSEEIEDEETEGEPE